MRDGWGKTFLYTAMESHINVPSVLENVFGWVTSWIGCDRLE